MAIFQRSIRLNATPAQVYAFHEDPRNISKISPPSLFVEQVKCTVPARKGEEFQLRIRQFGVRLEWIGYWEEIVPNKKLVDGARKSPFTEWHHQHLFRSEGDGCMMTDLIHYTLTEGMLGRLIDETVMKVIFTLMFRVRHRATKEYFDREVASSC